MASAVATRRNPQASALSRPMNRARQPGRVFRARRPGPGYPGGAGIMACTQAVYGAVDGAVPDLGDIPEEELARLRELGYL